MYFATKDSDIHPFKFQYTRNGQYSYDARKNLDSLDAIGLIERIDLTECEEPGAKWNVGREANGHTKLLKIIAPSLANSIDIGVDKYGYLQRDELVEQAHLDDLLRKTVRGHILFEDNLPDEIDVNLSADDCLDLELSLNPNYVNSMRKLIREVESGEISLEQWRKIDA